MNSLARGKFYNGVQALSHEVNAQITDGALKISGSGLAEMRWAYQDITIEDADRGVVHYAPLARAQLIIEDAEFIQALNRCLPHKNKHRIKWSFVASCLALMAMALLLVFVLIPQISPMIVPHVPTSVDERLGNYGYDFFSDSEKQCHTPAGDAAFSHLLDRLMAGSHSEFTYQIRVIDMPVVNAMTFPGGHILVFAGLIKQLESPDEIAGILAHEIGHSEKRHGTEMLLRSLGTTAVLDSLTGGGGTALYMARQLNDLKFSRAKEREADNFAFALMQRQNINPMGMAHFFARLYTKGEEKNSGLGSAVQLLSSHPGNAERMKAAQALFSAGHQYSPVMSDADWVALKNICGK